MAVAGLQSEVGPVTLRQRMALAVPSYRLLRAEQRLNRALRAQVEAYRHDLAVVTAERDGLAAHYALAVTQRDSARAWAVNNLAPEWSEADLDRLSEWGVEP